MRYVQAADRSCASGVRLFAGVTHGQPSSSVSLLERNPPAASGTDSIAAPTFVQLGVMGADVIAYIPQSKERLTAEQTWPVLALDVPEAMHD